MSDDMRERLVIALHDLQCPDRRCDPQVMGKFYAQAEDILPLIAEARAAGAAEVRGRVEAHICFCGAVHDVRVALDGDQP